MNAKIKLITLAIIIGIIVLVFPNFVNAKTVTISDNTKVYTYAPAGLESQWRYYTIGELINGGLATTSATHVFKNEFLFCYEPGQDLNGTNYYLVMEKYKLENNKITKYTRTKKNTSFSSAGSRTSSDCINFAKGLAYIMSFYNDSSYSHDRLGDSRSYNNFGPTCDDINLALWGYLDGFYKSSDTTVKNFFGIPKQDVSIDNTAKKISKSTAYYGKNGYKWVTGSSTKAYNLYKNALNVYKGTLEYDITAEFYKFRELYDPGSQQDLMFLKTITYEPPPVIPEIKLNFYKVDYNTTSTGLSGAELKLEKASNVDSISKTTIQSSGSNGKFDTITIKPTKTNPGTVKIKVTETKAPSGYDKLSDTIELTIKYNKTTGKVTKITESSDYIDTSISSGVGVIKFKNKPLIKLRLYKRDYTDVSKKVNGAKIKIERESNVANINGSTSAVTLTSSGDYGFFDQITLEPTDRSKQMQIKITETTVPTNYEGLPSSTILTIKYNSNTGKVTSVTANKNSGYFKFETPTSGDHNGKGLIYIKNKPRKITDLTILKTNIEGNKKLQGAKFTLYLNNVKSVKIGSKTFTLSSMTEDQKYTASSGITLLRPDSDRLYIYGLTTNSSGEIKIPEIMPTSSNEIYVRITEEQAPEGYEELPDSLNLILKYNGEWKLYERKGEGDITNELASKYWTLNTGNNLKVQLKNEEEPEIPKIKLDFYKVDYDDSDKGLEGAKLKIEKATDSNIASISKTTVTSEADGKFGRITITPTESNSGTVKIKVTETQAPDGYDGMSGSVTLTIKYNTETGAVTGITENSDYIDTSKNSGVGIVKVKNKIRKITNLTILKTDMTGGNKLSGAKFTLYLNNIKSVKIGSTTFTLANMTEKQVYTASSGITLKRHDTDRVSIYGLTTNSSGEIKIPEIIATSSDTIYVEITEGKAPDGYEELPDSLKLVLKKDGEWKLFERKGEGGLTNELDSKYWTLNTGNNLKVQLKNEKQPEEPEIPKIKLDFYKVDYDDTSKGLEGAKLKIEKASNSNIDSISKTTITSKADGGFGKITITPTESNSGTVKIKVTESQAPEGYDKISGSIELTIKYNKETGEVTEITESSDYIDTSKNSGVGIVKVKNKKEPEIPKIKLDFYKVNYNNTSTGLSGAKLKIEKASNSNIDSISKTTITSGTDGKFDEIIITPTESNPGTVKIKVTETQVPAGYQGISGSIELTIKYNTETGEVTEITEGSDYIDTSKNEGVGIVYVKNKEMITSIILEKKDPSNPNANMDGAQFEISLTNISKINGADYKKDTYTVSNGVIKLEKLEVIDANSNIEITVKEVAEPTKTNEYYYKPIQEEVKIILTRSSGQYSVTVPNQEIGGYKIVPSGKVEDNKVSFVVNNVAYINLSGQVWIDGQIGDKAVIGANGEKDDGNYLNGIDVHLYSIKDNKIIATTQTKNNGEYSFEDVVKTAEGYKIQFEYNGILYEEVRNKINNPNSDSDARENADERKTLNNNFKVIDVNGSNNGTKIDYNTDEANKSKFIADVNGNQPEGTKITAYTEVYKTTTSNIDCGVLPRIFDLAIGTDVKSAKLKINGKTTTYNYKDIIEGRINAELENKSSEAAAGAVYNLYLYKSDYNYRIADYQTDMKGKTITDTDTSKQLEAKITYSVVLKAQTTQNSAVEEFVYHYDERYSVDSITTDKYDYSEDKTNRKITFTRKSDDAKLTSSNNYRVEVDITFKININGLDATGKDATNVVEITKYSTDEGGYIDRDSQPGNGITNGKISKYEDDTDEAKVINISVQEGRKREISGKVFDDTSSVNGKLESGNDAVNDVIVQLIEIKNIGGTYCEYIWQETRSGNSEVRITGKNGTVDTYPNANDGLGDGKYRFTDFIPGNYIIRFIYGDGRTYNVTPNVEKYNGQAYQSTIDTNYNKTWYNTSGYGADASVATDNESRRLKTMAYTVEVDGKIGIAIKSINTESKDLTSEEKKLVSSYYADILKYYNETLKTADETDIEKVAEKSALEEVSEKLYGNKELPAAGDDTKIGDYYEFVKKYALQKTWMSAETLTINIPVDATKITTNSDSTEATEADIVNLNSMNFGLRLRPQTKLTVEKHITALKIIPTGVGVQSIVDAKADIGQILDAVKTNAPVEVSRYKNRSCNNSIKENRKRILESRNRYRRTCTRS